MSTETAERHVTEVDGYTVILDVDLDRYFLARRPSAEPSVECLDRKTPHDTKVPQALSANFARPPPSRSIWPAASWRLVPALASLLDLNAVSETLEKATFGQLIDRVRGVRPRKTGSPLRADTLLASFNAARPFYWRERLCRLDAPALCLLMRRHGYAASLVFGVRLQPFMAHCWAELDGAVLNEPHENIQQYTPILAI